MIVAPPSSPSQGRIKNEEEIKRGVVFSVRSTGRRRSGEEGEESQGADGRDLDLVRWYRFASSPYWALSLSPSVFLCVCVCVSLSPPLSPSLSLSLSLSHHVLVGLGLPLLGCGEGGKPQYGERMSENRPHVHPFCFFSPSSLFLFQLLYSLKTRDNQTSVGGRRAGALTRPPPGSHQHLRESSVPYAVHPR